MPWPAVAFGSTSAASRADTTVGEVDVVREVLDALPSSAVLGISGVTVMLESALIIGMLLPGASMLLTLGLVTRLGDVDFSWAVPVAMAAAVVGGQIAYLRGRRPTLGSSVRSTTVGRVLSPPTPGAGRRARIHEAIGRAEAFVLRHGFWAVLSGQWVVGLRTFTPRLAGRTRLPYRVFVAASVPAAALWAASLVTAGHYLGLAAQERLGTSMTLASVALVVAALVWMWLRRVRARARPGAEVSVRAALPRPSTPPALTGPSRPATAQPGGGAVGSPPEPTAESPPQDGAPGPPADVSRTFDASQT